MQIPGRPRVVIIGARGIGRHHAKWWALEGAEVAGFAGTSEATVAQVHETLAGMFAFTGRGYTDVRAMLDAERPDIVDVCSPPSCHYEHARLALEADCHVLCEKPFVYDGALSAPELLGQARELVELATARDRQFGICAQFYLNGRVCHRLWREISGASGIPARCRAYLASPARGRALVPAHIWIELGPHLIGLAQALAPGGALQWQSLTTEFSEGQARTTFTVRAETGATLRCELTAGWTVAPPGNIRRIELDDVEFVVQGENDANGIYRSRVETGHGVFRDPDPMHLLIRDFLAGTPVLTGQAALDNLDWLLRIKAAALGSVL